MLLISIVDYSEQDIAQLHSLLEIYFRRTGTAYIQRVYKSGMDFVRSSENSDIVFLETRLDRLDGLETARIMRKLGSEAQLIFLSRSPELAIQGYAVDALDFLLKPLDPAAVTFEGTRITSASIVLRTLQPTAQPAALLPPAQAAAILRGGQPLALRYVERGEGDLTAAWKG